MIVYNAHEYICEWVAEGLGGRKDFFAKSVALGVIEKGKLCAGIVYNNFATDKDNKPLSIEMSIYSIDKSWCNRHNLKQLFCYPFAQLKLERVQAICSAHNEEVLMFLTRLGFTKEGYHRKAYFDGGDAISFGMLKEECKWIGGYLYR